MRFRYHRGGFQESMDTTMNISSMSELWNKLSVGFMSSTNNEEGLGLKSERYDDPRNNWDNHWLKLNGQVVGITDGPVQNLLD